MCKQAPSPFCNRTGLFLLHFHENIAMLLPQLLQITVMLLTPPLPYKKVRQHLFYIPETRGSTSHKRKVAMLKFRVSPIISGKNYF